MIEDRISSEENLRSILRAMSFKCQQAVNRRVNNFDLDATIARLRREAFEDRPEITDLEDQEGVE